MATNNRLPKAPSAQDPKDWQNALIAHLCVFDELCQKHDIKYFLAFGGLLGAIRHRGFIPWDNDVDVMLTEAEYEKLLALHKQGLFPEGYTLVDRTTEKDYPLLFGRFVNTKTSCPLSTSSFNGGVHGVFIDVFILYPLPSDPVAQDNALAAFLVWEQMTCWIKRRSKYRNQLFVDRWMAAKEFEAVHGREAALEKVERDFRELSPDFSEAEWCLHGSGGAFNGFCRMKTEWFSNSKRVKFEDVELAAPVGDLEFLDARYGSGWRLLPKGERFQPYSCASLSIPGNVITADYMRLINENEAKATLSHLTNLLMKESVLLRNSAVPHIQTSAKLYAEQLERKYGGSPWLKAFDADSIPTVSRADAARACEELSEIIDLRTIREFKRWRLLPPISEDLLFTALWAQFIDGDDFWTVQSVIKLWKEYNVPGCVCTSPRAVLLENALDQCAKLYNGIDRGEIEVIRACTAELERICPACVHTTVGRAWLRADDPAAQDELSGILQEPIGKHEYLQLLAGKMKLESGDHDEALSLLSSLAADTNDGMILIHIRDLADRFDLNIDTTAKSLPKPEIPEGEPPVERPKLPSIRSYGIKSLTPSIISTSSSSRKQRKALKRLREEISPLQERYNRYREIRRITNERLVVWEQVYPLEPELEAALEAEDFSKAKKIIKPYVNAAYRLFDATGFGLYVDELTFRAAQRVFENDRGADFLKQFTENIPACHREEDFADMLRRYQVQHPYFNPA